MAYEVRSTELKEIQDTSLAVMREARARTANLKYDKLALDGAGSAVKARRQDLVERLNVGKLGELEAKLVSPEPSKKLSASKGK